MVDGGTFGHSIGFPGVSGLLCVFFRVFLRMLSTYVFGRIKPYILKYCFFCCNRRQRRKRETPEFREFNEFKSFSETEKLEVKAMAENAAPQPVLDATFAI